MLGKDGGRTLNALMVIYRCPAPIAVCTPADLCYFRGIMRVRLTVPQMTAFLKLAELGSFRDAASALGVSQPALSRTIQIIEARIGARLFDRDTRHIRTTPAGEKLRPIASRLLAEYDTAFNEIEDFVTGRQGLVRIAALPSVAATLLPRTVAAFREAHPTVRIDIWEDVGPPVHRAVREGEADIGLAPPPGDIDFNFRPLFEDEVVLVCRKDDPLVDATDHDWFVLRERPFLTTSPETGLRGLIEEALDEAGVRVEPSFSCKYPTTVAGMVSASLGIGVLSRLTLAQLGTAELAWRPLRDPVKSRTIGMLTNRGRSLPPAARHFMRELERQARAMSLAAPLSGGIAAA